MEKTTPFAFFRDGSTRWDGVALIVVVALLVFCAEASRTLFETLTQLHGQPLSLDPRHLPEYAARTTLRMFLALALSMIFTLSYATWAAKSERMGKLLVPILDILQSVPVLGFISITVVFFMSLAPGRVLGAEFAAIFAIFTSQAWNMAFSFYQSLRTVPTELIEAADSFHLTPWMRFWQLEVPFAMPALVWNMMMSMSGGWFFVVASEAINVGHTTVTLPGIGSYIALAIEQRNMQAIGWAIATMFVVILTYDQLFFRPLVAWCDRFRIEQEPGAQAPQSWALTMMRRSRLVNAVTAIFNTFVRWTARRKAVVSTVQVRLQPSARTDVIVALIASVLVIAGIWHLAITLIRSTTLAEAWAVVELALLTMTRVFVLIALASAVWLPVGIWVGLTPRVARWVQPIAQFLAAFPANLLFPVAVYLIVRWRLHPDIWLSPLMILGTQWYILFNVIAGAAAMPAELRYAAENFGVTRWLWWRRIALPAVLPFYVTGAITASGGSWNAAIVAELASWGNERVEAHGLGAYIAAATEAGDFHRIALGIAVMCIFVAGINRLLWRPLYQYAERKFRLT